MTTQMNRMDVLSNNIANADTTGFKRDIPITQSFSRELEKRINDNISPLRTFSGSVGYISRGLFVDTVATDFSIGGLRATGGTLDMAVLGDGFFVIGSDIERYTRDGSFTLNAGRILVTREGSPVMGENGIITVPDGELAISENGDILVDGVFIDRIRTVDIENKDSLRKYGDNLYEATAETIFADFTGQICQGFLERSNVRPVREMVEMITLMRAYEANQKVVTAEDALLGRAVNDIARR